jgi:hypothetical protein
VTRPRRRPFLIALLAVSAALVTSTRAREAHAEEPSELDTADGVDECEAFVAQNQKEMTAWEKSQPPVPYQYPREKMFLNAPWAQFFSNLGRSGELVLATLIPHVGAQFRSSAPAAHVSWPWSVLVFGPMYSCSRKKGTFRVHGHRVHRILLEPAVISSNRGIGFTVRPGYRFIWHPSSWVVGPGLGLGSTVEIKGNQEPFRYSIGPEAVAHFGTCCRSSYFTLAFRYDHFFKGNSRDIVGASLGYTFF